MNEAQSSDTKTEFAQLALEAAIRVGLVALMVFWCFQILRPFLIPVLWGMIIAIGVFPVFRRFRAVVGGSDKLAAILFVLIAFALLITPTVMLAGSAVSGAQAVAQDLSEGTLEVPPPPAEVVTWPLVGRPLNGFWSLASDNLEAAILKAEPQLREYGARLLGIAASLGMVVVQFVISILIAGVFLANPKSGKRGAEIMLTRLAGKHGADLVELARATITSVVQGVVGVAIIQSVAAGIGLIVVDVPAAGLWAVLVLVLAVIQLPPILVLGPAALYVFTTSSSTVAVTFLFWCILVSGSDTFLKPLLMGRGVDVPMIVILLGALGGMMMSGIIGLFVGAVVLAVTYKLVQAWLALETAGDLAEVEGQAGP